MAVEPIFFTDADLPEELRDLHAVWNKECFPVPNEYTWAKAQWHIFVHADDVPVSYVGIFLRNCTLDGSPLRLAGIGSVMTPAVYRKRGYATTGLRCADEFMREALGAPFALLVTHVEMIPFYEGFGWHEITDPMLVRLPDGSTKQYEGIHMILSLSGDAWRSGTIDLCGIPW